MCDIPPLLIRADAGGSLGTGHVMRMIALAQAWQDRGGLVTISACQCPQALVERILSENIGFVDIGMHGLGSVEDCNSTVKLGKSIGASWIAVDGYHFQETYQKTLKEHGFKVLAVDDYGHCDNWHADLVLNQNIQNKNAEDAYVEKYPLGSLRGPRYALLRREFQKFVHPAAKTQSLPLRILVTFGGVDPIGASLKVLKSLNAQATGLIDVKVLAGPANTRLNEIIAESVHSPFSIEIIPSVKDMPSLYCWADRVISAGGSSCYEWMYFGIPGWVTSIAENQDQIVRAIIEQKMAAGLPAIMDCDLKEISANIGEWLALSDPPRPNLIDGYGAMRVTAAMSEPACWVRPVNSKDDAQFLFDLANHESVRLVGVHTHKIEWDEHTAWLHRNCQTRHNCLLIIETVNRGPAGLIRFHERESNLWEIGISIHPNFRKERLAYMSLLIGMRLLARDCVVSSWLANIKSDNLPSQRLFSKLGFTISHGQGDMRSWYMKSFVS